MILVMSGPGRMMYQNLKPEPEGAISAKESRQIKLTDSWLVVQRGDARHRDDRAMGSITVRLLP